MRLPADLFRTVAVALAAVLTAGAVALSVKVDSAATTRMDAFVPHLDRALAGQPVVPKGRTRAVARPCRVSGLVGAPEAYTVIRDYQAPGRSVEVALYRVPNPHARLRPAAEGLRRCGSFVAGAETPYPMRYHYAAVTEAGQSVTYELQGRIRDTTTGGRASLSVVGGYLLYVGDTRFDSPVDAAEFAALVRRVEEAVAAAA